MSSDIVFISGSKLFSWDVLGLFESCSLPPVICSFVYSSSFAFDASLRNIEAFVILLSKIHKQGFVSSFVYSNGFYHLNRQDWADLCEAISFARKIRKRSECLERNRLMHALNGNIVEYVSYFFCIIVIFLFIYSHNRRFNLVRFSVSAPTQYARFSTSLLYRVQLRLIAPKEYFILQAVRTVHFSVGSAVSPEILALQAFRFSDSHAAFIPFLVLAYFSSSSVSEKMLLTRQEFISAFSLWILGSSSLSSLYELVFISCSSCSELRFSLSTRSCLCMVRDSVSVHF